MFGGEASPPHPTQHGQVDSTPPPPQCDSTGEGGEGRWAGLGDAIDQVRSGGVCAQSTHDCLQNCRSQHSQDEPFGPIELNDPHVALPSICGEHKPHVKVANHSICPSDYHVT